MPYLKKVDEELSMAFDLNEWRGYVSYMEGRNSLGKPADSSKTLGRFFHALLHKVIMKSLHICFQFIPQTPFLQFWQSTDCLR